MVELDLASFDGETAVVGPIAVGPPQTNILDLASFDGATPVAGISVRNADPDPDPFVPSMYAELWSASGTFISTLSTQTGVQFQDTLNDVGSGRLTIQRDDPDAAQLVPGREVRCYMFGDVVFTWEILQPPQIVALTESEEAGERITAAGQGRATLLDEAIVYPPKGLENPVNAQHRLYTFASPDYPNLGGWVPATVGYKANVIDPGRFSFLEYTTELDGEEDVVEIVPVPAPIGWPIPDAYWIWGQDDLQPPGKNYFRRVFTLTSETNVGIFVTGDNYYTLYLDGTPILGELVNMHCWQEYKRVDMTLPAGTYTLAALVVNSEWPPEFYNPGGFMCAVARLDDHADPVENIVVTDGSWIALPYPVPDPGWTPGQIMLDAIGEVQARGALSGFATDFTDWNDSLGNPWEYLPGYSIAIGNSVLDLLGGLVDQGWVDWRVRPGTKLLQMFVQGSIATPSGIDYQVTHDVDTQTIRSLSFVPQVQPRNRYLVKWTSGYFEIEDVASQALWGQYEGFMTVDAPTLNDALSQAGVMLEENANPKYAVVVAIDPLGEADSPYDAYSVGNQVGCPGPTGVLTQYQVHAITVVQTDMGRADITLELNARINLQQREQFELLKGIGQGLVGDTKYRNSQMAFSKALGVTE